MLAARQWNRSLLNSHWFPKMSEEVIDNNGHPILLQHHSSGCSVSSPAYPSYTATWRPSAQPNSFAVVNSPGWRIMMMMMMILMVVRSKKRIALIFNEMWAGCSYDFISLVFFSDIIIIVTMMMS